MPQQAQFELTAEDYAYLLPDHWIMHSRSPDDLFTRLHGYYVGRVVEIIKSLNAKTVLEVGCGDGWASGKMADACLDVVGIDWSAKAIGYASILVPNARFHIADVRDKSFLSRFPGGFDAAALIEVLEHIPPKDCVPALRAITAVLKPGALFVLTTPSINFPNNSPLHYRHFTPDILQKLVAEAGGLDVVEIEGYGDVVAERAFYRRSRLLDNRYFQVKPLRRLLVRNFHQRTRLGPTPLDRCHGLIMTMRRH